MTILVYLALGLAIGGVSGLLGIGGGVLLLPALMWLFDLQQRRAAGITLTILAVPVVLPAVWQYFAQGLISWKDVGAAAWIAAGFAAGSYLGASLVTLVPVASLRLVFGLFMFYIAARFVITSNSEAASAALGLFAFAMAWLSYLGLRGIGRRHRARPDVGVEIRRAQEHGRGEPDYSI